MGPNRVRSTPIPHHDRRASVAQPSHVSTLEVGTSIRSLADPCPAGGSHQPARNDSARALGYGDTNTPGCVSRKPVAVAERLSSGHTQFLDRPQCWLAFVRKRPGRMGVGGRDRTARATRASAPFSL